MSSSEVAPFTLTFSQRLKIQSLLTSCILQVVSMVGGTAPGTWERQTSTTFPTSLQTMDDYFSWSYVVIQDWIRALGRDLRQEPLKDWHDKTAPPCHEGKSCNHSEVHHFMFEVLWTLLPTFIGEWDTRDGDECKLDDVEAKLMYIILYDEVYPKDPEGPSPKRIYQSKPIPKNTPMKMSS